METPSSARIIKDIYMVFKALEIVYHKNVAAVEGLVSTLIMELIDSGGLN